MAKTKVKYICEECSTQYSKWSGKCEQCNAWNSIVEMKGSPSGGTSGGQPLQATSLVDVDAGLDERRVESSLKDIDVVLGGGFVRGGVYLLAGQPGIGKSTLLLQLAAGMSRDGKTVLYVSGEESVGQIKMRAER